ncbi:MAG: Anucleate primary sterigmata protein B [Vezdaea acicularis]|nr:MAG: Anucleate primary sterigmata protein B [Vezdaea acicularis]
MDPLQTSSSAASTVRRESQKIPGSFDDDEPPSPHHASFEHSESIHDNAPSVFANSSLPPLPNGDSSLLHASSEVGGLRPDGTETLDEREMRKQLMDIESSFLPEPSVLGPGGGGTGVDDSLLFGAEGDSMLPSYSNRQRKGANKGLGGKEKETIEEESSQVSDGAGTPPSIYKTPAPTRDDSPRGRSISDIHTSDNTSSLENMSSSPTAAAAARTISRAVSMATVGGYETADDRSPERRLRSPEDDIMRDQEDEQETTPRKAKDTTSTAMSSAESPSKSSTQAQGSDAGIDDTDDAAELDNNGARSLKSGRRPKYLRNRHASQRSSGSSFVTNTSTDAASDITLGADYALQSGGAVPTNSSLGGHSFELSRSTSLGSIASGISNLGDNNERRNFSGTSGITASTGERNLTPLDEEDRGPRTDESEGVNTENGLGSSTMETPRATSRTLTAPTDTIIAQRVRNIQVPESVAREYRKKNRPPSPGKRFGKAVPTPSRGSKSNLTLKEQSSTIDRLTKENFDLKLKIFHLGLALDKRSEEGIKEMVSENVELKATLVHMTKEMKSLRRQVRDLEKKLKESEDGAVVTSDAPRSSTSMDRDAREVEETISYWRERVETYEVEVERLRNEAVIREGEKRRFAEVVKNLGERRGGDFEIAREETDSWRALLETETRSREQTEEENQNLRDEIWRLKNEATGSRPGNTHNSSRKNHMSSRSISGSSDRSHERNGAYSAASSTLVEQLRYENEELRREVSAQTSMLTSRNRERERLYQELEDVKLGLLHTEGARSIGGESIFERSASRAHNRSLSRASGATRTTQMSDAEREDYENKNGVLRDHISKLKLENQELNRQLESCLDEMDAADQDKIQMEQAITGFEADMDLATQDLQTMQAERDEALKAREQLEGEFEELKQEAQREIDNLEDELEQKLDELQHLDTELSNREENFNALQLEMRSMSESLVRLEDDHAANTRDREHVQQELEDANREVQGLRQSLTEANKKVERLTVQQESMSGEIAFLREEQDGDKIKIGELQSSLKRADTAFLDEKERAKDLEHRLSSERHQRGVVDSEKKQEVQRIMNELNLQVSAAKDDARRLKKNLTIRETEATEWKARLKDLEGALRDVLGDHASNKTSLIKSVTRIQRDLDNTLNDLNQTRSSLAEKERVLKDRDMLLENSSMEARRLSDLLDKERHARRADNHRCDQIQKVSQQTHRFLSQQETKVTELESARAGDRKRITALENSFRDQLAERNTLLLALWNRLSTLCGTDWARSHSLVNGRALPTLDVVANMLPGFSKNLLFALKTVEGLVHSFKTRVKAVERELWKEYQGLEHSVELRFKKLERVEGMVGRMGMSKDGPAGEVVKLRGENKLLKAELGVLHKRDKEARNAAKAAIPKPSDNNADLDATPKASDKDNNLPQSLGQPSLQRALSTTTTSPNLTAVPSSTGLTRHHSTSAVSSTPSLSALSLAQPHNGASPTDPAEQRWILRLRELEKRLKAEREARLLDRSGARKRLEEGRMENEELKRELERERVRREGGEEVGHVD